MKRQKMKNNSLFWDDENLLQLFLLSPHTRLHWYYCAKNSTQFLFHLYILTYPAHNLLLQSRDLNQQPWLICIFVMTRFPQVRYISALCVARTLDCFLSFRRDDHQAELLKRHPFWRISSFKSWPFVGGICRFHFIEKFNLIWLI